MKGIYLEMYDTYNRGLPHKGVRIFIQDVPQMWFVPLECPLSLVVPSWRRLFIPEERVSHRHTTRR